MPGRTRKAVSPKRSRERRLDPKDYQLVVRWSEADRAYIAEAPALRGCRTHGATPTAALRRGLQVVSLWLEDAAAHGDPIPQPASLHSGKLTLRLAPSLHQELARRAERERVSLNAWIVGRLAASGDD